MQVGMPQVARARRWIVEALAIGLASRIFSIAVVATVNARRAEPAANPFVIADAGWYLRIARTGYHADPARFSPSGSPQHDYAFYPAWPGLVGAGSVPFGHPDLVGTVLANVLFLLASVLIWRLFAERIGRRSASLGLALLAFSPAGYVFSLAYTESLFVTIAAASFLARGSLWRGPIGAAAMLTRVAGGAIVASAAVEAILARGRDRRAAIAAVVGGGAALACWILYVGWVAGDPFAYMSATPVWVKDGGVAQVVRAVVQPTAQRVAWLAFYLVVLAGAMLLARRDRELAVYSLVALALPLLPGGALGSMPRYALVAFPAFAMLADRLGSHRGLVLLVAFAAGQVVFAHWVISGSAFP